MTNRQLLEMLKEDMEMRGFSHWTKESYELKEKDIIKHFNKTMENNKVNCKGKFQKKN